MRVPGRLRFLDKLFEKLKASSIPQVFVETGTYQGETLSLFSNRFREIHTIELSKKWYEKALDRFANMNNTTCHYGDSAEILSKLLPSSMNQFFFT